VFSLFCVAIVAAPAHGDFAEFSVGGSSSASSIQSTIDAFRAALGDPNNGNNAGPLASGRREINWDGGGATMATMSGATLTAFQNTRGGTFNTPGTAFLQTPVTDAALTDIEPTYATTFGPFSPMRIFTPVGSNITDVTFSVPGSGGVSPATVAGFGAIFSDVDLADTTSLEFFDSGGSSIYVGSVEPGSEPNGSFSFLGALAGDGERVARVRITTGNAALGEADSNGNPVDVVVMDDFFYAEPVPEPTSGMLMVWAAIGWVIFGTRRRDGSLPVTPHF
jgi:hypothetical protein